MMHNTPDRRDLPNDERPQYPTSSRKKPRDSVADETNQFTQKLDETVSELRGIWDVCGITDEMRGVRVKTVYSELTALLQAMLTEETAMLDRLRRVIAKGRRELVQLSRDLALPEPVLDESEGVSLMEIEEQVRGNVKRLKEELARRITRLDTLKPQDQRLCDRLYTETYYIPSDTIPTEQQLEGLEEHVRLMQLELEHRMELLLSVRDETGTMLRRMRRVPRTDFERGVIEESPDDFILSTANVDCLKQMRDEIMFEYDEWTAAIHERVSTVVSELEVWWDKCHAPIAQRQAVHVPTEENFTEESLDKLRSEIGVWKTYYQERRGVLGLVEDWQHLWAEKVEFDQRQTDPNFFKNNRGCNLQTQLKRNHRVVSALLPSAEESLAEAVTEWKHRRPLDPIHVNGLDPIEFVDQIKADYEAARQREKEEKVQAKKKQLIEETRFGTPSCPSSATKRRPAAVTSPTRSVATPSSASHKTHVRRLVHALTPSSKAAAALGTSHVTGAARSPYSRPPIHRVAVPPAPPPKQQTTSSRLPPRAPPQSRRRPMVDVQPAADSPSTPTGRTHCAVEAVPVVVESAGKRQHEEGRRETRSDETIPGVASYTDFAGDLQRRGEQKQSSFIGSPPNAKQPRL